MKNILPFTFCILLQLTQVRGEDASSSSSSNAAEEAISNPADLSRAKRAVDMRRLARGIQMLRLGKRSMPLLRLGKRAYPEDDLFLQDLLTSLGGQYYNEDLPVFVDEPLHPRYRRSADLSHDSAAAEALQGDANEESSSNVKRSVSYLEGPEQEFGDEEGYLGGEGELEKRPMSMLRLGKRPVNMLRLGKRPMSMLRLGKRPMSMLRLGKREGDDEELIDSDSFFNPSLDDGEGFSADKRPMSMLRLGKRPMSMLRLGKRPMSMLRLGKRPMSMLRLGKRPMSMLRLGKRPMSMLRLGKRQVPMLRLGKRSAQ